jgi:hypothetical protein
MSCCIHRSPYLGYGMTAAAELDDSLGGGGGQDSVEEDIR